MEQKHKVKKNRAVSPEYRIVLTLAARDVFSVPGYIPDEQVWGYIDRKEMKRRGK